ncbi:hypothetical protein Scep_004902 [Stephania cephalantha]|uniref:non-specific serine/threonine protein kinase n=1 Tax=Stephania cephalantha TaxID=152367 RepID=A0AAP0KUP7_9MAGN
MGCCSCFEFLKTPKRSLKPYRISDTGLSEELLFNDNLDDEDIASNSDESTNTLCSELHFQSTSYEDNFFIQTQNGTICRENENGNKILNEYVRKCKIGSGSYGKVVLYKSINDGNLYVIKAFHKSRQLKVRVAPSETAMNDVLREVLIMKKVDHANIVNLVEVIDDPSTDHFNMVLEYIEGKRICDSASNRLGEVVARKYLRNIIAGLMYLHAHVSLRLSYDTLLYTGWSSVDCEQLIVNRGRHQPTTEEFARRNSLQRLETMCVADPKLRMSLSAVAEHPWIVEEIGLIPQHLCICKRRILQEGMPVA